MLLVRASFFFSPRNPLKRAMPGDLGDNCGCFFWCFWGGCRCGCLAFALLGAAPAAAASLWSGVVLGEGCMGDTTAFGPLLPTLVKISNPIICTASPLLPGGLLLPSCMMLLCGTVRTNDLSQYGLASFEGSLLTSTRFSCAFSSGKLSVTTPSSGCRPVGCLDASLIR